jgi:hypothetical protein
MKAPAPTQEWKESPMNTEKVLEKTAQQAQQEKQAEKKLTIRASTRGGLAVRLMID